MALFERLFRNSWSVTDDRWYVPWLWGEPTKAGASINESTALAIPAVWACIRIISEDVGSLPLHLYSRLRQGKERATNHPLYALLHDRPNPEMSAISFRETMTSHILAWGNCFAEKELDGVGNVRALWPLPPNRVDVYREPNGGEIYYKIHVDESGPPKRLNRNQMLHIPGLSFNGLVGYSPIGKMREALGMAMAMEEYGARFFGQGTNLGTALSHPGKLSPNAYKNIKESIDAAHQGLSNAHRMILLEEGMRVEKLGIPPEDAQFLESRKFQLAEIARIYRMPLHKLQEYEKGTSYASVEQFSLDYVVGTLRPWLVRFEQGYNWQLSRNSLEQRRYFWEHLVEGLLRGDTKSRTAYYEKGIQNGYLSANDIRGLENMNPVPGGDTYWMPLNMAPVGEDGLPILPEKPAPAPQPPDQTAAAFWRRESFKGLFQDAIEQILSREANGLKRIKDKANGDWSLLVEEYYNLELAEFIEKKIAPVIEAYIYQNCAHKPDENLIQDEVWFFVTEHMNKSKETINAASDTLRVLEDFSSRAPILAVQSMKAINGRLN